MKTTVRISMKKKNKHGFRERNSTKTVKRFFQEEEKGRKSLTVSSS